MKIPETFSRFVNVIPVKLRDSQRSLLCDGNISNFNNSGYSPYKFDVVFVVEVKARKHGQSAAED